ncbi:MAG: hypothetical protein ACFFKA_04970 [Candidatus Thorarchaeota archaeon]
MIKIGNSESQIEPGISTETDPKRVISNLLEQFIFNPDDLTKIKEAIVKHKTGEITSKELKELLLTSRLTILKETSKLFPFYADKRFKGAYDQNDRIPSSQENLSKALATANLKIQQLTQQLQERDQLLQELVPRIQQLEHKIKKNMRNNI